MRRTTLVVVLAASLSAIAGLAIGCGSAKKAATTTPGTLDTSIAYVKVHPGQLTLRKGPTQTIPVRSGLSFIVGVKNDGTQVAQNVRVTIRIVQYGHAKLIVRSTTIPRLRAGETAEAEFAGPFQILTMIRAIPLKVSVAPAPGEASVATYQVRFVFA